MEKKEKKYKIIMFLLFICSALLNSSPDLSITLNQANTHNYHNNFSDFRSGMRTHKSPRVTYSRQIDLSKLSASQLKEYFTCYKYSEKDVFEEDSQFMSDEFVEYAKTLPGYEEAIIALHKKFCNKGSVFKLLGRFFGGYTKGLQGRANQFYDELQQKKQAVRSIPIDNHVIEFAQSYDITKQQITHKFNDTSEYNLHKKFVNQLSQASELVDVYQQAPDCQFFLDAVGHGAAIGIEANVRHEKEIANKWVTFCHEALEIAKGVAEGIKEGIYNTGAFIGNVVRHPIETTQNFCHGAGSLLLAIGKVVGIRVKFDLLMLTGDYPGTLKYSQELYGQCKFMFDSCAVQLAATSNRNIAKNSTAFAVEWVLIGKAFDLGFKLCSRMKPLLNSIVESLMTDPAVEYAVATAEGVTMHYREKARQIGSVAKKAAEVCRPTFEVFQKQFMDKLAPQIAKLKDMFNGKLKGFAEFKNKFIKFNFEHFFGIHLKSNKNGISRLGGWHLDYLQEIEKSGIIKFINKRILKNGVYQVDLVYNGKIIKKGATFFPSNLTWEQVMGIFCEAYKDFLSKSSKAKELSNGNYLARGFSKNNIEIGMIFTKKGHLKTLYPIIEKVIKR